MLRTVFNHDLITVLREYIDDFPTFEYHELLRTQVEYMEFFFSLFQNVSFKKTEYGKEVEILGLLYNVTNCLVPLISVPHSMRVKIANAADAALATVATGQLNIGELQRALGLANFLACATHFA